MSSIRDVAIACGVSTATVSRVMNNHPGGATAETRERILETMRRMNYRPSAVARGLTRRRMNTLGVIMAATGESILAGDTYHARILDGILTENKRRAQKTLLYFENDWSEVKRNLPSYYDGQCDGLILMTPVVEPDFFAALRQHRVPFVVTGGVAVGEDISSVSMDDEHAGRMCTRHLIEQGHRRIAHLCGESNRASAQGRLQGYRNALAEAGIEQDESLILPGAYSQASGRKNAQRVLSIAADQQPTALFCADDPIAFGALQTLRDSNVDVPGEMSVVGVNDALACAWTHPPLTSFCQPYNEMGHRLASIVLSEIDGEMPPGRKETIEGTLIVRQSVGRPQNAKPPGLFH